MSRLSSLSRLRIKVSLAEFLVPVVQREPVPAGPLDVEDWESLQICRELSGIVSQKLRCAFHVFLVAHSGSRILINAVEKLSWFLIVTRATDKSEYALAQLPGELRHAGSRFPFQRLSIQTPFARDHNIDIFHF